MMLTKRKLELLAPAKDKKTAFAAIECGADAVYIGGPNFGARQAGANSVQDIKEVVDYAHKFYAKVHVTINTILTDEELLQAKELIHKLYEIGVDAIIVQDMGILELAMRNELPPIAIHMSTQCDNRTLEKAEFFKSVGVSRIILARELSLEQIEKICRRVSSKHDDEAIEVETFIHGALCVSYSGQCYFSQVAGGRSANRGECAQPCRKKFSLVNAKGEFIAKDKHLLSLKDFNATNYIRTLVKAGVKSFKIEGRLKDINYVKNVVAHYRKILDEFGKNASSGEVFMDFEPNVNKSFNRGFSEYFLKKRTHCYNFDTPKAIGERIGLVTRATRDFFEVKTKSTLNPQDGLCFMLGGHLQGCLVNRVEQNRIYPNRMSGIKVGCEIYRNNDVEFEKMLANSKTKKRIGVEISYCDGFISAIDDNKNSAKVEVLQTEVPKDKGRMEENFIKQMEKMGDSDFFARQVYVQSELPFLPISVINELRRELLEKLMEVRVERYRFIRQKPLKYDVFYNSKLDCRANVHNDCAKCFYEQCQAEVCQKSVESGEMPSELMRTKHCLKFAFDLCQSPDELFLIDDKNKKYPLEFDCKNCEMVVKPSL
ncbi:MAG: U32 family peptidase [Candidatus Gastranaerophilales bacterium]